MSTAWTITFDCGDPAVLAAFWCRALGYVESAPPAGSATWEEWLASVGVCRPRNGAMVLTSSSGGLPRHRVPPISSSIFTYSAARRVFRSVVTDLGRPLPAPEVRPQSHASLRPAGLHSHRPIEAGTQGGGRSEVP
jgi:Glyoxalase-like domain